MTNEEYQRMLRAPAPEMRERLLEGGDRGGLRAGARRASTTTS